MRHQFLIALVVTAAVFNFFTRSALGQHFWWDAGGQNDATCAYGQITVLATHPSTYYCGVNWHPGEPAGGYCGIQHNGPQEKRTIFSIWDTSPELHAKVTAADPNTQHGRFGGEGEGGHTHMLWPWKLGETFEFYVTKTPTKEGDSTDVRYYVFDRETKKWIHSATITCPNGGHAEVGTIGGGMNSFLENFSGQDKSAARLAIYRLWLGKSPATLTPLVEGKGDGQWGELHDAFFLAKGSEENLNAVFAGLEKVYGKPIWGEKGKKLPPLTDKPVSPDVIKALENLPVAPPAQ